MSETKQQRAERERHEAYLRGLGFDDPAARAMYEADVLDAVGKINRAHAAARVLDAMRIGYGVKLGWRGLLRWEWRYMHTPPPQPVGWVAYPAPERNAWLIGPWWLMLLVRAWRRRWGWMEWLMELDDPARFVEGIEYYPHRRFVEGIDKRPRRRYHGRFLEYPYDGCYFREIRPRGWHRLRQFLADFRREIPRW